MSTFISNVPQLIKQFVFGGDVNAVRKAKHGDSSGVRGAAWYGHKSKKTQALAHHA